MKKFPKIIEVIALKDAEVLAFFDNGKARKFDTKKLIKNYPEFAILKDPSVNALVKVEPGGYGISWTPELDCSEGEVYNDGVNINIALDDFYSFVSNNLFTTNQAADAIKCTKQNIADLANRNKIRKIPISERVSLYSKSELLSRRW